VDPSDPWRPIYAACLGLVPEAPTESVLQELRYVPELTFEDFLRIERVWTAGSAEDLLSRLEDEQHLTPRQLSMIFLAYGSAGSMSLRDETSPIPRPWFKQLDAGPNVIVVCSPNNLEDAALLWNLRSALGDRFVLPTGVLAEQATQHVIERLAFHKLNSLNGFPVRSAYLTSCSISVERLREIAASVSGDKVGVASCQEILSLGRAGGWVRTENLVWQNGRARFVPLQSDNRQELFVDRSFNQRASMFVDLEVLDQPFPAGDDVRVEAMNYSFYAGSATSSASASSRSESVEIYWPSRLLTARSVAACRGLELRESEPGRAARVALADFPSLWDLSNLLHQPLLQLLEEMAARQGFGWYKKRLRADSRDAQPIDAVGPTTDELPEKPFSAFRKVLPNEKAAKYWLLWAEQVGLILKGFQLQCHRCRAKQWIPVNAFLPPIICRGCAEPMTTPFAERPNIDFRYRLSERLRRVYEHDAIGHLLVMRHMHALFENGRRGSLVGTHPGLEVLERGSLAVKGEADVLALTRDSAFVPIEVKRTSSGFTPEEIEKFNAIVDIMKSPWSGVAVCQYGRDVMPEFTSLEDRTDDPGARFRVLLSYDLLLDPMPFWQLGGDPFRWRPLTAEEIQQREANFVQGLASASAESAEWLDSAMLHRPSPDRPMPNSDGTAGGT
jgi:hypothetical protein